MIRTLWILTKIAVLVAAGWWVAHWAMNNPGTVQISWLGYDIEAHIGLVLLAGFVVILAALVVYRIWLALVSLPMMWGKKRADKRRDRGMRALVLGLSAVAAGDARVAGYQAARMRKFMPKDGGLPHLLEAQAARLQGNDLVARAHFDALMRDKDTAFLGVRGLMQDAMDHADVDAALVLARKAQDMHPKQKWILRTVFGLEVQKHDWASAEKTLKSAERVGAFTPEEAQSNRLALLMAQADQDLRAGLQAQALHHLRDAIQISAAFVPAAVRLARLCIDLQKKREAARIIERAWRANPHPDLIPLWDALAPENKASDAMVRMRWYERLVALRPDHAESQLAAARAALEGGLWGEVRQYLVMAETLHPSPRIYRLWARLEEKTGHPETAKRMLEKAADAPADPVWTCRQTGRIYERWAPIAEPHGTFNTIVWDYPDARKNLLSDGSILHMQADPLLAAPMRSLGGR